MTEVIGIGGPAGQSFSYFKLYSFGYDHCWPTPFSGFLTVKKKVIKSKMTDPRWQFFGNNNVIPRQINEVIDSCGGSEWNRNISEVRPHRSLRPRTESADKTLSNVEIVL